MQLVLPGADYFGSWFCNIAAKGVAKRRCAFYHPHQTTSPPSSRYECVMEINVLNTESVSRYKQPFRLCMRNKILRSANAKYHYSQLFFYKINKGDLLFDVTFFIIRPWDQSLSETQTPIFNEIHTQTFKSNSDAPLKLIPCKSGPKEAFLKTLKRARLNPKQPHENEKGKL